VQFTNNTVNANTFKWYFGDGGTSNATSPSHTYNANGNYDVSLVGYGGSCGTDSITRINYISINSGNTAQASLPMTGTATQQTCCLGVLYDSGGQGDYQNNTSGTITLAPPGAISIRLMFVSFYMEGDWDFLYIYDGPTTASPLIGKYSSGINYQPPPSTITSSGGTITLLQTSDTYLTGSGFEINWQCNHPNTAPTANFKADATETCTGVIQFTDLSVNGPTNWLWDFGDGSTSTLENPVHAFDSSGTFTITLTISNSFGHDSLVKMDYITTNLPASPAVTPAITCDSSSATLTASGGGQLDWYDAAIGGNLAGTGNTFITPVLYTSATYYVEDKIIGASQFGGKSNNLGGGSYFNNNVQHGLCFNCTQPCLLASVKVYAQGADYRTFFLMDSSGSTIHTGTYNIPAGESWVTLNWNIPAQNGLQLMGSPYPNLYRNGTQGGPNMGYPFDIGGKINIYQGTAGVPNSLAYYYFFYDWEIQEPTCISARIPVTATVIECNGIEEMMGVSGLDIGPNPASDHLKIQFTGSNEDHLSVTLYDVLGRPVLKNGFVQKTGPNFLTLAVDRLSAAVYFLKLENSGGSTVMRVVVR
jgi:PKD repeat protein